MVRLLVVALLASCTHAQSSFAKRAGEVMAIGGVGGLVASIAGNRASGTDLTPLANFFAVTSAVGIVVYAITELSETGVETETSEQAQRREHRWARTWLERAQIAARLHKCERVRSIEVKIQLLDAELHDVVLMQDPDVLRCLSEAPAEPEMPVTDEQPVTGE